MEIERCEVREEVEESIDYERLRQELSYDDVESLLELIVDVVSSGASTMRIGGEVLPAEAVKQRFRQLDGEHIKYVIDSLRKTTTKINNIRDYLLTALYNAPVTIGPYYPNLPHGAGLILLSKAYFHFFIEKGVCGDIFIELAQLLGIENAKSPYEFLAAIGIIQRKCDIDTLKMSDFGIDTKGMA